MSTRHDFYIPVMGTAFTIDSPLKVGPFGIHSVVSIVDDRLIEEMREHYCKENGLPFDPIPTRELDHRAMRISAYFDLMDELINKRIEDMRANGIGEGTQGHRYFSLLPDHHPLKAKFETWKSAADGPDKNALTSELIEAIVPGRIDANIMTKLDRTPIKKGEPLDAIYADAMAAARGFANSKVHGGLVMSAGMNRRLFKYLGQLEPYQHDENGFAKKPVIVKVSDYRSALIQGRILAKFGVWASEYRIESGLNCGGHTFATKGVLMGPVLQDFQDNKQALIDELWPIYLKATKKTWDKPHEYRVTVQGGVGNADEMRTLTKDYGADAVGWGTPFLLVPEATTVDEDHRKRLADANVGDVIHSHASPLSIPFWLLKDSDSERARRERIAAGKPGSACPKGYLVSTTEFTKNPLCLASKAFQKLKLIELKKREDAGEDIVDERLRLLNKSCICHDLAGGATRETTPDVKVTPALCPGPNLVNFSSFFSLDAMIDHIYGRKWLPMKSGRIHMFLREIQLYLDYFTPKQRVNGDPAPPSEEPDETVFNNLTAAIEHYRTRAGDIAGNCVDEFNQTLDQLQTRLQTLIAANPAISAS